MSFLKSLFIVLTTLSCLFCYGQDRLPKLQKPQKMVCIVDTISLKGKIHHIVPSVSEQLYGDYWVNTKVNPYRGFEVPAELNLKLSGFSMPCESRKVTSDYGYRKSFNRYHYGVDIKVYIGDPIYAAWSGKVRVVGYDAGGYGNYIVIRHNNGLETVYGHLSKQCVKVNQIVKSGEKIGEGGNTGRSTGSHLHFETRILGKCINPQSIFDFQMADLKNDNYHFVLAKKDEK